MDYDAWGEDMRGQFHQWTDPTSWRLRYAGPGGGNGNIGDSISHERAEAFIDVFSEPYNIDRLPELDLYDRGSLCPDCRAPYCYHCWHTSAYGWGICPNDHSYGIDPYYR
ncbi:MAG: hypothetical protein QM658_04020 [Gordonia sp. (in: high G+C Gram-positive bacteria)]